MKYIGPKKYRPISAWGYIGYMVLYTIPIIGTIFLIGGIVCICVSK